MTKPILACLFAMVAIGCAAPTAPPAPAATPPHPHAHNPGDHNHARGKMLMASDGSYNALLTAHLSAKDGNELDIFVEDKDGPYALKAKTLEAVAQVGAGEKKTVSFECAPANERPAKEAEGTCSHYVAKTPWMRTGETMRVETTINVGDHGVAMTWRDFEARKYAHHEE
jgi:hypothetical protein